jgi:CRISPR-associated protein Cmr5
MSRLREEVTAMPSALRTLEQERAKHAWDCVQNCLNQAIQQLEQAIQELEAEIAHEADRNRQENLKKRRKEYQDRLQNLRSEKGGDEWKGKYGSVVRKLPSYILTNGLGQTLAFLKAKGKGEPGNEHEVLYRHLADWVGRKVHADGDLLSWLVNTATSQQYRLATMEALALLQWLKRFAEAELPKGREE